MLSIFLKWTSLFFVSIGLISSLSIFAFKILFHTEDKDVLTILGPDIIKVYTKPKILGGKKVANLDIEILNNRTALINNEKLRPLPSKPELLPIEIFKEQNKVNNVVVKNKISKDEVKFKKKINNNLKNNNKNDLVGMYRVQFGSFRDLTKANYAMKNMQNKHFKLLKDIKLEIFSYKNNDNLIFFFFFSSLLLKKYVLKLCYKFKFLKIVFIL